MPAICTTMQKGQGPHLGLNHKADRYRESYSTALRVWADTRRGKIINSQAQVQTSQESKTATEWCVAIAISLLHEGTEQLRTEKGDNPGRFLHCGKLL